MKTLPLLFALPIFCAACGANDVTKDADNQPGVDSEFVAHVKDATDPTDVPGVDATERPAARINTSQGAVQGYTLDVAETVFVEGTVDMGTEAPVLVVVQSATKGICAHLQNGTYPKGGTFFPMALIQADGRPVSAHRVYSPSNPDDATTDNYFTFAQLRHFNDACSIEPAAEQGMAVLGSFVLDSYTKGEHVAGRYRFQMGDARDAFSGAFDADFCDAPNLFVDYMNLLNPTVDSAHCL